MVANKRGSYKQRLFVDLDQLLLKYPNAKVSDVIWSLEAVVETLWRALPMPKEGRKVIERQKRYRVA